MLNVFCLQAIDTYCPQGVDIYKEHTSKEGVWKLFQAHKQALLGNGEWLLPLRIRLEFYTWAAHLAMQHLLFLLLWLSILALCSRLCHFSETVPCSPLPWSDPPTSPLTVGSEVKLLQKGLIGLPNLYPVLQNPFRVKFPWCQYKGSTSEATV